MRTSTASARRVLRHLVLALVAALWLALPGCRDGFDQRSGAAFVERWRQAFNSHDLVAFTALYAPTGNYTAPGMVYFVESRDQLRQVLDQLWRASPDMQLTGVHWLTASGSQIGLVVELSHTDAAKKVHKRLGATFMNIEHGLITGAVIVFPQ